MKASAAAKVSEDLSIKDAEILRLIEERKSTPKEEKQRLKEVSKSIQKCIRDRKRMKRQMDIQRILEDFKGIRNIPGIKSAKKRVLITKIKKTRKENASHLGKELPMSLENSTNNFTKTKKDESEQEAGEDENNSSTDVHNNNTEETTRIPEITTEELQTAINKLKKKANPRQQWYPSRRH